jgi:hypothetical protein
MDLSEPRGHVGIEAGNEGDAGRPADPGGTNAGDRKAEHEGKRNGNPPESDAAGHIADRLHDALKHIDILADSDEESERRAEVKSA